MIDSDLQNRRQCRLGFRRIGKFIEHQEKRLPGAIFYHASDVRKRRRPVGKSPRVGGHVEKRVHGFRELDKVLQGTALLSSEIERRLAFGKLIDKRRFAHAAAAVYNRHLKAASRIHAVELA